MALGFRKSQYNLFSAIIRPLRPLAFISWASSPTNTSPILAIESIRLIIPFVYLSDQIEDLDSSLKMVWLYKEYVTKLKSFNDVFFKVDARK